MIYERIYSMIHVGKNILIVGYNSTNLWTFRVVNQEGKIVQERDNFSEPEEAEIYGHSWIKNNLSLE